MLARGKGTILTVTLLALLAGGLFLALTPPLYRASTLILIDQAANRAPQNAAAPAGVTSASSNTDAGTADGQPDTHVEIIRSDAVVRRTMDEMSLFADDEYSRRLNGPDLRLKLENALITLVGGAPKAPVRREESDRALEAFRNALSVKRVGIANVVGVEVLSRDPEKAARIANALAQNYLANQSQSATDSTRQTTQSIIGTLDEMRERLRVADNAVETFKVKNGINGAQGGLVTDQQLQEISNRLISARARSAELKAKLGQHQRLAKAGGAQAGAATEALQSVVVTNLRQSLADIARREAEALEQLSPNHPAVRAIRAERDNADKLLGEELARIAQSAKNDYDAALANEEQLAKSLADLKKSWADANQAQAKSRELQREADAARAIFETFLARAKQPAEPEEVSRPSIRILTRAAAPFRAAYPDPTLVMGLSLAGGLLLGVLLAWLRQPSSISV